MNYGKTAYLKILDIEKELNYLNQNENNLNFCEFNKPNIDFNITTNTPYNINLGCVNVEKNKNILFQIKTCLQSISQSEVEIQLLLNDNILHSESKTVYNQETETLLIKTYSPLTSGPINLKLLISTKIDGSVTTIKNISTIVLGTTGDNSISEIELRAVDIAYSNEFLISYIDNNELYYLKSNKAEKSLTSEDFNFLLPAKSHCFCLEKFPTNENPNPNILLYRVDPNGNLFFSNVFNGEPETLIDENVDVVFASPCPVVSDDFNIIVYIKNGKCYFRTMRESGVTSEKKLPLANGNYIDIRVVSNSDSEYIYVVATHENGSNYILHSLVEVSTGKITEFLSANYSLSVSKYIDLSFFNNLSIETLSADFNLTIEAVSQISNLIDKRSIEKIYCKCNIDIESYVTAIEPIIYGVQLDKSVSLGTEWGSYTDGCVDFQSAYMDFDNDTFIDNGWSNRWPYNEIKPCLLKDGSIVGYLDPNDFSKFVDGTEANITDISSGMVMIEIPKIYYNITRTDDFINVQISNTPQEGFVCYSHMYKGEELDKIYISAYLNGSTTLLADGFLTPSGATLSSSTEVGYEACYNLLKEKTGERYEFLPYNVLRLLQCLYIIMFKNTDSQTLLGSGYSKEQSAHTTGLLNLKGMNYGTTGYVGGVKFLGLEDIYACRKQIVTGFYITSNDIPKFIDPYNSSSGYSPSDITNYITTDKKYIKGYRFLRTAIDINEDANYIGFFARSWSTNKTYAFCDSTKCSSGATSCVEFGNTGTTNANGMFAQATVAENTTTTLTSARLVYYP